MSVSPCRPQGLGRTRPPRPRRAGPCGLVAGFVVTEVVDRLAAEIRQELIDVVTRNGGHLGAILGAVELTIALHCVFDSPRDRIVWDVGHQAYAHKLLTGRRDRFATIRQEGGLSGFLSRDESEHDAFGAGHASTVDLRRARHGRRPFSQSAEPERGASWRSSATAPSPAAWPSRRSTTPAASTCPFIVVLNDNEMSIAPNVGAMSQYLDRVRTDPRYNRAKDELAAHHRARCPRASSWSSSASAGRTPSRSSSTTR